MNQNPPQSTSTPPAAPAPLGGILAIAVVLVIIGLIVGFVPRLIHRRNLDTDTRAESAITVSVISPVPAKTDLGTPLPAEVEPFVQASIHARASGYLKDWYVDIGDHVTNGQVLAEIDTPELDQQIAQADAQLAQAEASLSLAKTTADRWTELLKTASVSDQETAEKVADNILAEANVKAAQANLNRLQQLKNFDSVTAPFDGTITARNTDIGQLINAGSGPELFRLAQTSPLRVYVRVPQPLVHAIVPGQKANLIFQEAQGRTYAATVTRTAGAVDPESRTLQVELQVPNDKNEILAGSYAQVRFNEAADAQILTLSDNALIFRAQGMQVAIVDNDYKVHLQAVVLGRDTGNTVQILDGISATDRIILNPPDSIADGMTVAIANPADTKTVETNTVK
jgi:membrane fusion protein (multidrug efflux system)